MKISDLLVTEKYDPKHKCKTPGAVYSTEIHSNQIQIQIELPFSLELGKKASEDLESELHYAVEAVLAKFF